jgi:hypothetical protein
MGEVAWIDSGVFAGLANHGHGEEIREGDGGGRVRQIRIAAYSKSGRTKVAANAQHREQRSIPYYLPSMRRRETRSMKGVDILNRPGDRADAE